jgi:monoamine oxidase
MSITRRTLLTGATGLSVLAVAACTPEPGPSPEPSAPSTAGPPRPTGVARSSWSSEPFSRGATSFLPVGAAPADRARLAAPVADRLFFAGEATSVDSPNSVEGARASGVRAAGEVLRTALLGERIAVIGAGTAGAACAHRLSAAGHDVVVVEARERVGGRVQTLKGGEWPVPVELGALRIGREQPSVLRDALQEIGLTVLDVTTTVRRAASGDQIDADGMREAVLARARGIASEVEFDIPLSTALARLAPLATDSAENALSETEAAAAAVAELVGARSGALARQISVDPGLDEVPGGWEAVVSGGLESFVESLLEGVDVLRASAVAAVLYDDAGAALRLGSGESLAVDRVVVTVPLGVLQDDGIVFEPPLPRSHREAIASLGVGTLDTLILRFDEATWGESAHVWLADPTQETLVTEWINLDALLGAPVLVGIVGPQRVARLAALGDDEIMDEAMTELAPFFGAP